jgi:hypothetical protein
LTCASASLAARMAAEPSEQTAHPVPDHNVSVAEAAQRLAVSPTYIYKHVDMLPFTRRIGRRVTCSSSGLERFNAQKAK